MIMIEKNCRVEIPFDRVAFVFIGSVQRASSASATGQSRRSWPHWVVNATPIGMLSCELVLNGTLSEGRPARLMGVVSTSCTYSETPPSCGDCISASRGAVDTAAGCSNTSTPPVDTDPAEFGRTSGKASTLLKSAAIFARSSCAFKK